MKSTVVRLTESALMLAVGFVLSLIPVMSMPFGGTITLASMLPIILIAYRHGTPWGLLTGFAGSLLQLLMGLNNLSYATSPAAALMIILFDYVIAFSVLGLGGIFRRKGVSQTTALIAGILLCCVLRFGCHFLSGITVWRDISIPVDHALWFSFTYNAAYMVPETILTVALGAMLSMSIDFGSDKLRAAPKTKGHAASLVLALISIVAGAVAAVKLFAAFQTDSGFSFSAMTAADGWWVGIAAAICLLCAVLCRVKCKKS